MDFQPKSLWIMDFKSIMDYGFFMEWIWIYDYEEHELWNRYEFAFKSFRTHCP